MADLSRHAIPARLDDPERWLFWTLDEAAVLLGPVVIGLAANAFVTGLLAGLGGWALLRRSKRGAGGPVAVAAIYWFLPGFVLNLKGAPPSCLRRFIG